MVAAVTDVCNVRVRAIICFGHFWSKINQQEIFGLCPCLNSHSFFCISNGVLVFVPSSLKHTDMHP